WPITSGCPSGTTGPASPPRRCAPATASTISAPGSPRGSAVTRASRSRVATAARWSPSRSHAPRRGECPRAASRVPHRRRAAGDQAPRPHARDNGTRRDRRPRHRSDRGTRAGRREPDRRPVPRHPHAGTQRLPGRRARAAGAGSRLHDRARRARRAGVRGQRRRLSAQAGRARTPDRVQLIPAADVTHMLAKDRATYAVTASAQHMLDLTLAELERRLYPARFLRINRGILVNLAWVAELRAGAGGHLAVRLKDAARTELAVSRDR